LRKNAEFFENVFTLIKKVYAGNFAAFLRMLLRALTELMPDLPIVRNQLKREAACVFEEH